MKITDNRIKAGLVLLGALAASAIFFVTSNSGLKEFAYADGSSACANGTTMTLSEVQTQMSKGNVKVSVKIDGANEQAIATIVNNTSCGFPASFADYKMYDQKLSTQQFYVGTATKTIAPNSTATFTIALPSCMAQADVYYGDTWKQLYDDNRNGAYTLGYTFYGNNGTGYSNAAGNFCKNTPPPPPAQCKLEIIKKVDKTTAAPGDTVTYTISYKNTGTADCTGSGVRVEDIVDSDLTYITGSATQSSNTTQGYDNTPFYNSSTRELTWSAGTLAPGQSGWVSWKGKVNEPNSCGTYDIPDTAKITSFEYAGDSIHTPNPSTWVTSNAVDTSVTKSCTVPISVSCSASASSVKTGVNVSYTAKVSGGNGSYSYTWSGTDSLSGDGSTVVKSYSSAGTKTATVKITSDGVTASATCSATVTTPTPNLQVSCSANPTSLQTGQTATFTAHPTGGNGSYSYTWTGTDGLSGTAQSASKGYSTDGTKTGTVTVTSGNQTASASCDTTVTTPTPNLQVSCSANPTSINTGDTATFTAQPSGGTGSYTYSWTGTDGLSGSAQSVSKSYSTEGTKTGMVTVTSGNQTASASCNTNVNTPPIQIYCTANYSSVREGDEVTYTAYPSGGAGSYSYSWTGTDGLSGGNTKSVNARYGTQGTKTATVTVTSGSRSATASCNTQVYEQGTNLIGSCSVDDNNVEVGDTVVWRASASGGSGTYYYDWSGDDGLDGNNRTEDMWYNDDGRKDASVRISDSQGNSVVADCSVNVEEEEHNDLDVSCSASPSDPDVGDRVTWKAYASGGGGDYDYDWSGDDGLNGDDRTEDITYNSDGTKDATVRVRSDDGESETVHCHVNVQSQNNITVFTNTGTTPTSQIYLSQVPYTGPTDNWKIALYALAFLLWSGGISYYILRRKYGDEALAVVAAKAESFKDEFSNRISSLRSLHVRRKANPIAQAKLKVEAEREEMLKKLWDRTNS